MLTLRNSAAAAYQILVCYSTAHEHSQPDCNLGWDSHLECYFFGYHLYMYVASDSHSDLPVFPLLERASRHDMLSFLHSFFSMKAYLPEFRIEKLLLDSAHDAYAVYEYCRQKNITPFIDLNPGHTGHFTYKGDFTIDEDGVPICKMGLRMHKDGYEASKHRAKTVVQNQIGHVAASVSIPVPLQNTEEPYTFLQQIIQDYLTYRQETVKHGKRNMMEVLP